jgi:hypothetical protein
LFIRLAGQSELGALVFDGAGKQQVLRFAQDDKVDEINPPILVGLQLRLPFFKKRGPVVRLLYDETVSKAGGESTYIYSIN